MLSMCLASIMAKMETYSNNIVADFMSNLPEKFTVAHKQYVEMLAANMQERTEFILDFNGLQASIDPAADCSQLNQESEQDQEQKINYDQVLLTYFKTNGTLANILTFKLRGFERASADFPLADGIRQLHTLTELDLAGNKLSSEMQKSLQLWSLTALRTLKLDKTGLKEVPPSIGRLRQLRHLSLSENSLTALPVTLSFCQAIIYLNISKNNFQSIPGVILQLQNLTDLRRLDNPLPKRWEGYESFPHLLKKSLSAIKKKNPDHLQALCTRTIMTCHVDYWSENSFPPLQCKMLDSFASMYTYCENCHNAIDTSEAGWEITVLVLKFAELRDVPFRIHSCGNCCKTVEKRLTERQRQLSKEIDDEYEESMRQALKDEGMDFVAKRHTNSNRRRTRKCAIM